MELRNNLLLTEGILSSSCDLAQKLSTANSLAEVFRSPNLKRLTKLVDAAPEILRNLVDAITSEDLHRFIVNNQLPDLIADFPATFCDPGRPNRFSSFVNTSTEVNMVVDGLCATNWTLVLNELMAEFVPVQTYVAMANPNSTLDLLHVLNKSECLVNAALGINWNQFIDISALGNVIMPIIQNRLPPG